jgi:hypothetical protein
MRPKRIAVVMLGATMAFPAPAAARDEQLVLEPSSQWVIDYADDSCVLRRGFAGETTQLELRYFAPYGNAQVSVVSKTLKTTLDPLTFRFEPGDGWGDPGWSFYASYASGFSGPTFSARLTPVPGEDDEDVAADEDLQKWASNYREALRKMTGLTLIDAFERDLTLRTGSLDLPMQAMDQCLEELTSHWDIDVVAHRDLYRAARPQNQASMSRRLRFPPGLWQRGASGIVNIRMAVSAEGRPTACHVQMALSDPAFERETCDTLLEHLRFRPALDKNRQPLPSYWTTSVRFIR